MDVGADMHYEIYEGREDQRELLEALPTIEWGAGKYMYKMITSGEFHARLGETARLYFLREGEAGEAGAGEAGEAGKLVAFVAIVEQDYHPVPEWDRWIAFLYVWPEYRGRRLSEQIISDMEQEIRDMGEHEVHILTRHFGLYDKYGYEFVREEAEAQHGKSYIYRKSL